MNIHTNLINEAIKTDGYKTAVSKSGSNMVYWGNSPLYYVHSLSSKSKGAILEEMVIDLCENVYNLKCLPRTDQGHDSIINGHKTEIKASMTWNNIPYNWKWQQIRRQQLYDRIIFLGDNPDAVYLWWATKTDLNQFVFPIEYNMGQHGGQGASDTYWLPAIGLTQIPHWFKTMENWNNP